MTELFPGYFQAITVLLAVYPQAITGLLAPVVTDERDSVRVCNLDEYPIEPLS